MNIKYLEPKDLDDMMQLEVETWPEGTRASRESFKSRIDIFPQGVIGSYIDGKLAGLSTSMIIDLEEDSSIKTWEDITDDGMITNHNPEGNKLYVVSLGVGPHSTGLGIGKRLIEEQSKLAKKLGLESLILGSRVPKFHTYEGEIEDYLGEKNPEGYSIDPLVRFYQKCGLDVIKVKPNYMEDDKESRHYGVIMSKKI